MPRKRRRRPADRPNRNPVPYREDADTNRPLSPYAASKKAAEAVAYTYHYLHGIDISVPRYFTVYGPAGRPDMSVFRFVRRIAEGEPIVVFGDRPVRLSDLIERIAELLDWTPQVPLEEGLRRTVERYRQNREMVLPLELGDR